jgi:hypothetical protein
MSAEDSFDSSISSHEKNGQELDDKVVGVNDLDAKPTEACIRLTQFLNSRGFLNVPPPPTSISTLNSTSTSYWMNNVLDSVVELVERLTRRQQQISDQRSLQNSADSQINKLQAKVKELTDALNIKTSNEGVLKTKVESLGK